MVGTATTGDIISVEQTVPDLAVCAVILPAVMITRMFYSAVIPSLPWPLHNIILGLMKLCSSQVKCCWGKGTTAQHSTVQCY